MKHKKTKRPRTAEDKASPAHSHFSPSGRMLRLMPSLRPPKAEIPTAPVAAIETTAEAGLRVTCVDYCPERMECRDITDIPGFLSHHRPAWARVRWINISGTHRVENLRPFAEKYQLHPLAIEDVTSSAQRPKVEDYPGHGEAPGRLFIVARVVHMLNGKLHDEQISLFLGRTTLLSFQETPGGVFEPIYRRLEAQGSRIRDTEASFLCYSLLDAIVDSYFPFLEYYSDRIDETEEELLDDPRHFTLQKTHAVKRGLLLLRRAIWPMREMIAQLLRERHECLSETTLTYFRDIYDHCVQIIDLNETYHEIATALTETYMSVMSNRMNEIMKVLTVISTIFMPLTFIAGVYGMNMPIPENHWSWSYPVFWLVCLIIGLGMLVWFRRRDWI
ncbi:magnesium transporter [Methylomagnum ishizawai]|uniref:Magnesium transport protein CorA n=1 Tax=Methylomagnum ishizawai TaxID=1760988 RepID=A0A1Y6D1C0_9GAMM|nr:magnesium/cobalt transporter CorA [Methylomagnum ishizawai]SMF96386.1 magnesium transporter [Methylomagnum ishizawai]